MEDNLNNINFPNKLMNKETIQKKSIQEVYKTERNIINHKPSDLFFCKKDRGLKNNMNYQKIFNLVNDIKNTSKLNNSKNLSIHTISHNDLKKLEKNFRISSISNSLDKRLLESNISTEFKFSEIKIPKTTFLSENQKIIKKKDNLYENGKIIKNFNNIYQNGKISKKIDNKYQNGKIIKKNDFMYQNRKIINNRSHNNLQSIKRSPDLRSYHHTNNGNKVYYRENNFNNGYKSNQNFVKNGISYRIKNFNDLKVNDIYDSNGNQWDTFRAK